MHKSVRVAAILGCYCLHSLATSTVVVPGDGGPMPYYFAGTNCRASGYASVDPAPPEGQFPAQFQYAELAIGPQGSETIVRTWSRPTSEPLEPSDAEQVVVNLQNALVPLSLKSPLATRLLLSGLKFELVPYQEVYLAVMFDSSHFPPLNDINIKFTAIDNYGREYVANGSSPAKNYGWAWNHADFDAIAGGDGAEVAKNYPERMQLQGDRCPW